MTTPPPSAPGCLAQRTGAEFIATACLLIAVVGSGIAAENLSAGNVALALLANALATGAALFVLILVFAPLSGAHMNPAVSLLAWGGGVLSRREVLAYIAAQLAGGVAGVVLAHLMFGLSALDMGTQVRTGPGLWLSEGLATLGLLGTIAGCKRYGTPLTAGAVGAYIAGAYWFTASTAFANPAVTLARSFTDTFTGIRLSDAPAFVAAQLAATGIAILAGRFLGRNAAISL